MQQYRVLLRTALPWRRLLGHRAVRRNVQGVELVLPWSHALPDYGRIFPNYGQNLVALAAGLQARRSPEAGPLPVLDIGANIGDSALQIIAATDARVLCVEGDPHWVGYLRRNVGTDSRVVIEDVLLAPPEAEEWQGASPVRTHGTTRFVRDEAGGAAPTLRATELRARHPDFDQVRLVKSDTDGFDPMLVPAAAQAWHDVGPVLFFEFDPMLARAVDDADPNRLWDRLADLGYDRLAVWDNLGDPLGRLDTTAAREAAASLEPRPVAYGYHYWDVAACRSDDSAALATFDELVSGAFTVTGATR